MSHTKPIVIILVAVLLLLVVGAWVGTHPITLSTTTNLPPLITAVPS